MATKTYINNDYEVLAAAMQALVTMGYFASVEYTSNTVTCYDSDENAVLTLSEFDNLYSGERRYIITVSFRLDSGTTKSVQLGSTQTTNASTIIDYIYICSSGAYILTRGGYGTYSGIFISKTNNDKIGILVLPSTNSAATRLSNVWSFATDDELSETNTAFVFATPTQRNQTTLMNIPTGSDALNVSYFPDVLYTFTTQYHYTDNSTTPPVNFTQNGKRYLWVGYFAIRDED